MSALSVPEQVTDSVASAGHKMKQELGGTETAKWTGPKAWGDKAARWHAPPEVRELLSTAPHCIHPLARPRVSLHSPALYHSSLMSVGVPPVLSQAKTAQAKHARQHASATSTWMKHPPQGRKLHPPAPQLARIAPSSTARPRLPRRIMPCFWHAAPNSVACPQWPGLGATEGGRVWSGSHPCHTRPFCHPDTVSLLLAGCTS